MKIILDNRAVCSLLISTGVLLFFVIFMVKNTESSLMWVVAAGVCFTASVFVFLYKRLFSDMVLGENKAFLMILYISSLIFFMSLWGILYFNF